MFFVFVCWFVSNSNSSPTPSSPTTNSAAAAAESSYAENVVALVWHTFKYFKKLFNQPPPPTAAATVGATPQQQAVASSIYSVVHVVNDNGQFAYKLIDSPLTRSLRAKLAIDEQMRVKLSELVYAFYSAVISTTETTSETSVVPTYVKCRAYHELPNYELRRRPRPQSDSNNNNNNNNNNHVDAHTLDQFAKRYLCNLGWLSAKAHVCGNVLYSMHDFDMLDAIKTKYVLIYHG